jgi:hypothetical protein
MVPWACMVFVISFLYRFTFQVLWDVVFNAFWYARMALERDPEKSWRRITERLNERLDFGSSTFASFVSQMSLFKYSYDGIVSNAPRGLKLFTKWPTWTARPRVTIYRGFTGNCQDAEVFARKLLKRLQRKQPDVILEYQKDIYVPLDPTRLEHTHYIVSGWMKEKGQNVPFVVSNNRVVKCMHPDECARNILSRTGVRQYVWITREPWKVEL